MLELKSRKKFSKKRVLFAKLALCFLASLLFLSSRLKPLEGENPLLSLAQYCLYPFHYTFVTSKDFVESGVSQYLYLVSVAKENMILRDEKDSLKLRVLELEAQKGELERLKKLLDFSERNVKGDFLSTKVMTRFRHSNAEGFRISAGSKDGVTPGMPVLSPDGIVGKVIRTSYFFSDVSLLTDTHFVLDVLLERTRHRALLKGDYDNSCFFEVPKQEDIKIGDTLVSSGLLGFFKKGLPVGEVVEVRFDGVENVKLARVKLWAQLQSLEEVLVLKQKPSSHYKPLREEKPSSESLKVTKKTPEGSKKGL